MDLKILEKKEEPLLSRMAVKAEVVFEKATPSNKEIKPKLASTLEISEKLIALKNIYTKFGERKASVTAYAYFNEEDMKKIEPREKTEKKKEEPKEEAKK